MTLYTADFTNPKLQPGAYVHNSQHLYEVLGLDKHNSPVTVENVKTGDTMNLSAWMMSIQYELVREAPRVADTVDGEMEMVA